MQLTRKYHFYAAHRNQDLCDRCFSPHGHAYRLRLTFDLEKKSSITVLFSEIDASVKSYLDQYDHSWLIDKNDPLYAHLKQFPDFSKFRFVEFDGPTSVENLAIKLYFDIREKTGLNLCAVEVDETDSSTIRYTTNDALYPQHKKEEWAWLARWDIVAEELKKPCNENAAESVFGEFKAFDGWKS